jgi:hypothetical protein
MRARRHQAWIGLITSAAALALALPAGALGLGFQGPQYVDPGLAGGEPLVLADPQHGDLLYTSHEGTTHLYRPGLVTSEPAFETNYRDQVNMWTSKDNGATWQFVNYQGTGFSTNPAQNLGFSDPDLTQDAGGRIYNTGIDLANDALFSSPDGGFTWDRGTVQCHEGDRPWLAAGKKDEVFMSTDSETTQSHQVFQSTDGGSSCNQTPIQASGTLADGRSWTGDGKIYYDRTRDMLVEPMVTPDANGFPTSVGVDTWKRGDPTFTPGATIPAQLLAHWPAISLDTAGNVYLVWDTDPRNTASATGCSDSSPTGNGRSGAPLPNQIMMAVSHDLGKSWSAPMTVANPGNARVLWPWVVAGDPGKVSVVWYQFSAVADADCAPADTHTYVMDANYSGADNPATAQATVVNAAGRSIHEGGICQGGTTCVATGQDRRLGDFFTNQIDSRGCVMIASGDTERLDPLTNGQLPTSLPTILRQSSGPPLIGGGDCSQNLPKVSAQSLSTSPGFVLAGSPPAQAGRAKCPDHTAPVSRFGRRGVLLSRTRIVLSGSSHDTDVTCAAKRAHVAGLVARIRVSIGREVNHSRQCRYLLANGRFSTPRSCLRTSYLSARGTNNWHFDFVGHFPPGRYQVWVRGLDPSHNIERKKVGRNFLHVRIR